MSDVKLSEAQTLAAIGPLALDHIANITRHDLVPTPKPVNTRAQRERRRRQRRKAEKKAAAQAIEPSPLLTHPSVVSHVVVRDIIKTYY